MQCDLQLCENMHSNCSNRNIIITSKKVNRWSGDSIETDKQRSREIDLYICICAQL